MIPELLPHELAEACAALQRGEVIGLPTETVYGLAADASNEAGLRRVFAVKGRPADHPLIVHVADLAMLARYARDLPPAVATLARAFWPGPLTMILRRVPGVSDLVTGGQDTIGLRIPGHPLALRLIASYGHGLAAPSANRFGHVSPTTAQHVRDEFGAAVPIVLDGGPCRVGIESTIVDLSGDEVRILRPGQIDAAAIAAELHQPVALGATSPSPRVSGSLASHYAPETPAQRVSSSALPAELQAARKRHERVLVLGLSAASAEVDGLVMPNEPVAYARHLYAALRELDRAGADRILIEWPEDTPAWLAVRDRLARATTTTNDDDAP